MVLLAVGGEDSDFLSTRDGRLRRVVGTGARGQAVWWWLGGASAESRTYGGRKWGALINNRP